MRTSESICSLTVQSPEREAEGGLTNLSSVPLSSSSNVCISSFLSCSLPLPLFLWQIEAQGENVSWLNISNFLPLVFSLIGSSKDGYISCLAQTMWPHWVLPFPSNFVLHFKRWPILAHFPIHMYDKRENFWAGHEMVEGERVGQNARGETLQGYSCC